MKDVGKTNTGNFLVEITEEERRVFCLLVNSIKQQGYFFDERSKIDTDLSSVFLYIASFANARSRLNDLKGLVSHFERILEKKEENPLDIE